MVENTYLRQSKWLWAFRWVQLLFTLIALGVTAQDASSWRQIQCSNPAKLSFNIAVAALSLPLLIYLIPATGKPKNRCVNLPWNQWMQLFLDGFFLILWIAAMAQSSLTCADVCPVCLSQAPPACYMQCSVPGRRSLAGTNPLRPRTSGSSKLAQSSAKLGLKLGFNVAMLLLFIVTFLMTVTYIYRFRKQGGNATAAPAATGSPDTAAKEPTATATEVHEYAPPTEQTSYGYNPPHTTSPYAYGQPEAPSAGGYNASDNPGLDAENTAYVPPRKPVQPPSAYTYQHV